MNIFNRSHPYIQQMEDVMSEISTRKMSNTKDIMSYSIIIGIISIICSILSHSLLPTVLSMVYILSFLYLHIDSFQNESYSKAVNVLNGYDYAIVNINEKYILEIVEGLYIAQGKLDQFKFSYRFTNRIVLAVLACNIIFRLIQYSIPYLI